MGRETGQVGCGRVRPQSQTAQEVLALRRCHASLKKGQNPERWNPGQKVGSQGMGDAQPGFPGFTVRSEGNLFLTARPSVRGRDGTSFPGLCTCVHCMSIAGRDARTDRGWGKGGWPLMDDAGGSSLPLSPCLLLPETSPHPHPGFPLAPRLRLAKEPISLPAAEMLRNAGPCLPDGGTLPTELP